MAETCKSDKVSQWIWPGLCLIMAVMLITLVYQNFQLKAEMVALAERSSAQPPFAADLTGKTAPPFEAYLPDGQELFVHTDSLTAPLVLLWFAHGCEPCVQALDRWNRLADEYPGQVWGIPSHGEGEVTEEFSGDRVRFPILQPGSIDAAELYEINITPQTMVILENGTLGRVWYGPLSEAAYRAIVEMLQEPLSERGGEPDETYASASGGDRYSGGGRDSGRRVCREHIDSQTGALSILLHGHSLPAVLRLLALLPMKREGLGVRPAVGLTRQCPASLGFGASPDSPSRP